MDYDEEDYYDESKNDDDEDSIDLTEESEKRKNNLENLPGHTIHNHTNHQSHDSSKHHHSSLTNMSTSRLDPRLKHFEHEKKVEMRFELEFEKIDKGL